MGRQNTTNRTGIRIPLLLAGLLFCVIPLPAQTQTGPAPSAVSAISTRPCSANPELAVSGKKKTPQKAKHAVPPEPAPTCIEVKGEAIEVQEFLQSTARGKAWRIGENRASEDTWSYVRYLDVDELEQYANTKVLVEPVQFNSGKAAVIVRTTELGDGYVRVQISAHIQGEGKSTEKTMAQPGTVWPLNSKGVLEQELVSALQTGYKPLT